AKLKIAPNPNPLSSETGHQTSDIPHRTSDIRNQTPDILHPKSQIRNPKSNFHLFYLLFENLDSRTQYANQLKEQGILSVFHYQSLHASAFAQTHFPEQSKKTLPISDRFSDCLLRLPMFYELPELIRDVSSE
ncbi:DegT/DnrJ/EryC1/StrS family aminotransferase, partial [Algoriphagus sp.]|uniref:DegT/DnrJ/EryC1/StrS family aminotransferase n=1 Tax=Algoriphagus sp. TaxID=1872435 RepID=UPI00391C4CCB